MKKSILLLSLLLIVSLANATVWTCSNDPLKPAQYSNLQTAIDAATPNDTIYVYPSATTYGDIILNKPLTLIGGGIDKTLGSTLNSIKLGMISAEENASNSSIEGLAINDTRLIAQYSGGDWSTNILDNIKFSKCSLSYFTLGKDYAPGGIYNVSIYNSLLYSLMLSDQYNEVSANLIIENNIFTNFTLYKYGTLYSPNQIIFRNNLFINGNYYNTIVNGMLFENNIFYKAEPLIGTGGTIYNNNITFPVVAVLPGANNFGSGNKNNVNPMFVSYPINGAAFSWTQDFHLKPGSPAIAAGTDGSDIGIYGGDYPWSVQVNLPHMLEVLFYDDNNSVPKGGTLKVNFKANTNQ